MPRVLVIEDERRMLMGLKDNLELEGYDVLTAADGDEGLKQALSGKPDAIILDIMLPRLNGFDLCRNLRRRGIETPILMLSARGRESDKVLGLGLGADDYVTKPFSISELMARVRALIRRAGVGHERPTTYGFGAVELDFQHQRAHRDGDEVSLSSLEFEVLAYLIDHSGEAVSREDLLVEVWGYSEWSTTRAVDNLIARLRKKLEDDPGEPRHILTVHGVGYKFVD